MSDPVYIFKPGEGWIPSYNVFTMACGTIVTLEFRAPKGGERYMCINKHSRWGKSNPEVYFTSEVQKIRIGQTKYRYEGGKNHLAFHYATVVPHD